MSKPGGVSQGSLLELKAITAEHADRLAKEGKSAVRGAPRKTQDKLKDKNPFNRKSPGLLKRLAREVRNDAKKRHFVDDGIGPSDDQRRSILEAKARKYEAMSRGDFSGMSERELAEATIDFEAKAGDWSDHSSDVDESAAIPREWSDDEDFDTLGDMDKVEYVDEMGRTRVGTRRDAKGAERAREKARGRERWEEPTPSLGSDSQFIHGDQSFFPVYQPDPEALKQKWLEQEREARQERYDSTKEVRNRGAGAYQFSLDEETRLAEKAALDAQRTETEKARAQTEKRGMSAAQEAKKRRLDERRALVEAKRAKLLGGAENVARLREKKRAEEVDKFVLEFDGELGRRSASPSKK